MTAPDFIIRLLSVVSVGMAIKLVTMSLGWLDRRTGAPVMKARARPGTTTE